MRLKYSGSVNITFASNRDARARDRSKTFLNLISAVFPSPRVLAMGSTMVTKWDQNSNSVEVCHDDDAYSTVIGGFWNDPALEGVMEKWSVIISVIINTAFA